MWLGKQGRLRRESGGAELGVTSIPGTEAAVLAGGESRALPVYGPGELCLFSGEGAVILRRDGSITLRGTVKVEGDLFINGMPWVQAQGEGG